jgi:hypothetical protein
MKSSQTKQKVLASAMSLFLLGSSAIGAEKKKTLDQIVEPAAKVETTKPQQQNIDLFGGGVHNDGYGNLGCDFNFGTFYSDKKTGFLAEFCMDFPKNKILTSNVKDNIYRINNWGREGMMLSMAGLKGNPNKLIWGVKLGVGLQTTYSNSIEQDIGSQSIEEFLKNYVPSEEKNEKRSVYGKAGGVLIIPFEKKFYIVIDAGAKFGVKPTVQGTSYRNASISPNGKTALYLGLGVLFRNNWSFLTLNPQ